MIFCLCEVNVGPMFVCIFAWGHGKFVTPTATLEFVYLRMVDFAKFRNTAKLYRERLPLNFRIVVW